MSFSAKQHLNKWRQLNLRDCILDMEGSFFTFWSILGTDHSVKQLQDDVIKWKHFRYTGPLSGEFTGDRWIPLTKVSDAELRCFLWSPPEQTVE